MSAEALIAIAWVVVVFFAIVFALLYPAPPDSRGITERFFSVFCLFIALVLMAGALRFSPFDSYVYELSWPVEFFGVLIAYAGLALALSAGLGKSWKNIDLYRALFILALGSALTLGRVDAYLALIFFFAGFRLRGAFEFRTD